MFDNKSVFDWSSHNRVKFLFGNETIEVLISPINKFLEFLFTHLFSQFFSNPSYVLEGNEACLFIIE